MATSKQTNHSRISRSRTSKWNWSEIKTLASLFCCLFFPFILWGLYSTGKYVTDHNIRISLTNTTCHLLNYNVKERVCGGGESCYGCFDEQFFVSYLIFNGSYIRSVSKSFGRKEMHAQRKIKNNYTCFYQWKNVTEVRMELPDDLSSLIYLCIAFGLSGLCLFLPVIYLFIELIEKINCTCSCFSKTSKRRNDIYSLTKMTQNIEQSTATASLTQTGCLSEDAVI